jgi:NAD-dependent SIR2 family protein deacetylase
MPVRIGDRVSDTQLGLLHMAQRTKIPEELAEYLLQVTRDSDITSGREDVHPDWQRLFHSEKTRLQKVLPSRDFEYLSSNLKPRKPYDDEVLNLNPKEYATIFLLGAGASKPRPSDIPTVNELLPDLLSRARRLDRADLKDLADFCEKSKIENIEDLLTAAQLSEYCSKNPSVLRLVEYLLYRKERESDQRRFPRPRLESVELSAVAFLKDTLQVLFGLLSSRMLPARPNNGHKAIASFVRSKKRSAIVTTNYDCCMDLALGEEGRDFTYKVDFSNTTSNTSSNNLTPLIKLHGSLNWFYCDTCQQVHLLDTRKIVRDYKRDAAPYSVIAVCRGCGGQRRGLLVPPLALKFDVAPPLTPLIDKAQQAIAVAELVIVVGFSFAEADLYISRMLIKSMQMARNVRMVIFDPDYTIADKVRAQFSSRVSNFDAKRILLVQGDCSKTLPQFLKGDLFRKRKSGLRREKAARS